MSCNSQGQGVPFGISGIHQSTHCVHASQKVFREQSGRGYLTGIVSHLCRKEQLAPEGKSPDKWAQKSRVQLNRFCDRVYRVWRELGSPPPPLDKIQFLPKAHALFLAECSLMFPKDLCVAQEAIERAAKLSRKRALNKLLSTRSN
jgi:hypothetical protein